MDDYTRRTRSWLEGIYAGPPPGFGEYVPHSPVRGLSLRSQYIGTYVHSYAILRRLAKYEFRSLLDVGAGEGFLGRVIADAFGTQVCAVDLALNACRRARSLVANVACAEAPCLPFRDQSVDVLLSVNTLEHVPHIEQAVRELRRIARRLVIVALPHRRLGEPREPATEPHAHVSLLTRMEMQIVFGREARIYPSLSRIVRPLYALVAEDDVRNQARFHWLRHPPWNLLYAQARAARRVLPGPRMLRWLCHLEYLAAQLFPWWTYESIAVIELPGVRYASKPVPSRVLLDTLLRPRLSTALDHGG
jgi:SAM-dependent methyltransferase